MGPVDEETRRPAARTRSHRWLLATVTIAAAGLGCPMALAGPSPRHTVRAAAATAPNGAGSQPVMSSDARYVAFTSRASNLGLKDANGHVPDVYLWDQYRGTFGLISATSAPGGANGPSSAPAMSAAGTAVAFVSKASNLVEGDTNHQPDVFVRTPGGIVRASVTATGEQADGPSGQPAISADGRFVTFTSAAPDLAAGAGAVPQVYIHDLVNGGTLLVSARADARPGTAASGASAVSSDGHFVAFESSDHHLVSGDTNGVADVFVRDLATQTTQRVSVSSSGRQQNRAVAKPYTPIPDISDDGRFVAFDSDASDLVPRDRNRHTDVFVRDRLTHRTSRVSLATTGQEGDSDSFAPSLSGDGRYVSFESFAGNLTPRDPPREDVFVRDRLRRLTVMADVGSTGRPRGPEHVAQLLQRPAISDDGRTMAFVSTADGLVGGDRNGREDVFLRRLWPPPLAYASPRAAVRQGHIVVTFTRGSRGAGALLCRLDRRRPAICPLGHVVLPLLTGRHHVLRAFPGGLGLWYASRPIVIRISIRRHHAALHVEDALGAAR